MSYAQLPTTEPDTPDAPPPDVVAAARNIYFRHKEREATSDIEAMTFVKGLVSWGATTHLQHEEEKAQAAAANAAVKGVPPNVLAAAHSLFENDHGRPAHSPIEALTYAQRLARNASSGASASASVDAPLAEAPRRNIAPLAESSPRNIAPHTEELEAASEAEEESAALVMPARAEREIVLEPGWQPPEGIPIAAGRSAFCCLCVPRRLCC